MVFLEPTQTPTPPAAREEKGGLVISRGVLAVVAVLLFGAFAASTIGLMMLRNGEQARWAEERKTLVADATAAGTRATAAETQLTSVTAARDEALQRVDKYDAVERQLSKIEERTATIKLLLSTTPTYPVQGRLDLAAIPDWTKPAVAELEVFVGKLDAELAKVQAFARRQGQPPVSTTPSGPPVLTPTTPTTRPPG